MLQNFNIPGQTGKPYIVRAILDGEVIAKGECAVNAFTHVAYKACYDAIPAEYENRIDDIEMVSPCGSKTNLAFWLEATGY